MRRCGISCFCCRKSGQRPRIRPTDRLLWCFIAKFWAGWRTALYFVQPRTVTTWQKKRFRDDWRALSQSAKPGRPRISRELRKLIQRMWEANPTWGSPRIVAELAMPGIEVAKSTVEKYRPRRAGPPSPTWRTFLDQPVRDLVSIDFFHCSDGYFSGVVCLHRACAQPTANCSLQGDGTSYSAVDGATDRRSISV